MKWICDNNVVSVENIQVVEAELKIEFPKDFVTNIKNYDGGYPKPNRITVEGQEEVLKKK